MANTTNSFSDQVRAAIDNCGMSRHQLSKLTGVQESILSRFMAGGPMQTNTIDRLDPVLRLTVKSRPAKGGK
jgi:hypothetical protein